MGEPGAGHGGEAAARGGAGARGFVGAVRPGSAAWGAGRGGEGARWRSGERSASPAQVQRVGVGDGALSPRDRAGHGGGGERMGVLLSVSQTKCHKELGPRQPRRRL